MKNAAVALLVRALVMLPAGLLMAVPAVAASHTVVMEGMAFVPASLKLKRGDTVVWVNKDLFAHTASAGDRSFDSGEMAPGSKWTFVAAKPGTFAYTCTLHPPMKGTLVVE